MDDEFNKWCDLWDKAQEDGVFKDAPKPLTPTPQTSEPESFFGLVNSHPSTNARDCDVQYWNDVYELSKSGDPQLIQEQKESIKNVVKKSADDIVRSPNPITASSAGTDQDLTPGSLGLTFSEKDLEELAGLKLQLHDLTSKMASFSAKGGKQLESKIAALKEKIDEFSSELTHSLGDKKSTQGIEVAPMN
jgi:hypothetical protein